MKEIIEKRISDLNKDVKDLDDPDSPLEENYASGIRDSAEQELVWLKTLLETITCISEYDLPVVPPFKARVYQEETPEGVSWVANGLDAHIVVQAKSIGKLPERWYLQARAHHAVNIAEGLMPNEGLWKDRQSRRRLRGYKEITRCK